MSSIASLASNTMESPRAQMNARISAAVSTGSISSADQSALSGALNAIDSSLAAERGGGGKPSSDMKSKIDGLIQQQVESGTLTEDQANELQSLFAQGPEGSSQGGKMQGPGGPGGPPPAPPSDDSSDDESTSETTDETTTQLDALMAFLQQLRESAGSTTTYGGTSSTNSGSATGLVLDTMA